MEKKSQVSEQNFGEGKALMQCYVMCKIEFHDYEFWKIKRSSGIEFFKFSIKKVLKKYGKWCLKMCGYPASYSNGVLW